jgi:hypothetical protein
VVAGWSVAGRAGELRWCGEMEKDRLEATGAAQMPSVTVNGTEFYYEIRGTGPPVLLIMGATGMAAILTRSPACWLMSSWSSPMTGVAMGAAGWFRSSGTGLLASMGTLLFPARPAR